MEPQHPRVVETVSGKSSQGRLRAQGGGKVCGGRPGPAVRSSSLGPISLNTSVLLAGGWVLQVLSTLGPSKGAEQ